MIRILYNNFKERYAEFKPRNLFIFVQFTTMSTEGESAESKLWRKGDPLERARNVPLNVPEFHFALSKFPECELLRNKKIVQEAGALGDMSDAELKIRLVHSRWYNPLCHNCHYKTDVRKLKRCKGCKLVWYCDEKCQKENWKLHKPLCTSTQIEPDPECPYKMHITHLK